MKLHHKNIKTVRNMTISHHWLGVLGTAAVTIGLIGLTAPNIGAIAKPASQFGETTSSLANHASTSERPADPDPIRTIKLLTSSVFTPKVEVAPAPGHSPEPSTPLASLTQPAQPENTAATIVNDKTASPDAMDPESVADQIKTTKIRKGDNMTTIFRRLGLSRSDLNRILTDKSVSKTLGNIHPGQIIEAHISSDGLLSALRYEPEDSKSLNILFDGQDLQVEEVINHPESRIAFAEGTITNSFFEAAAKTGLSDKHIMSLADIFAWDVDFGRDIRPGDRFAVLYETLYRNDEQVGTGRILAAEFINHGQRHQAVHFEHKNRRGYYDPEGRPVRKAFLRSPVNFTRISSGFSLKRWHPKLHRFRAHKGVDYSAPTGTAVQAAGDGRVTFAGNKGGYGRVVIIQHGQRYSTLYAHLHRIKRGVKAGERVNQGQVIGTVGRSGLATGPHLHYEFRVDGAHRDPLKVKLPGAPALPKRLMAQFRNQTSEYLGQLAQLSSANLVATRD